MQAITLDSLLNTIPTRRELERFKTFYNPQMDRIIYRLGVPNGEEFELVLSSLHMLNILRGIGGTGTMYDIAEKVEEWAGPEFWLTQNLAAVMYGKLLSTEEFGIITVDRYGHENYKNWEKWMNKINEERLKEVKFISARDHPDVGAPIGDYEGVSSKPISAFYVIIHSEREEVVREVMEEVKKLGVNYIWPSFDKNVRGSLEVTLKGMGISVEEGRPKFEVEIEHDFNPNSHYTAAKLRVLDRGPLNINDSTLYFMLVAYIMQIRMNLSDRYGNIRLFVDRT